MSRLLELIEKPDIARHLPSALWLTSPKNRGEGRTTCLAVAFILNAMRNPGVQMAYFDHYDNSDQAKEIMRRSIEDISNHVNVDRRVLICNRSTKILPNFPKFKVKETIIDLVRSAVKLAKENDIDIEELIDVVRQEMVAGVMER